MAKYKDPLSKNPTNCFNQRFKGAGSCDVSLLVNELIAVVPNQVESEYGFKVVAQKEPIIIGGLLSKVECKGVLFSFPQHSKYAQILVGFNKVGSLLDVDAVQYGAVSKNMQHSNLSQMDHGFSVSGLMKQAYHKAMTDTNAIEEEEMHYQALIEALSAVVTSWLAQPSE